MVIGVDATSLHVNLPLRRNTALWFDSDVGLIVMSICDMRKGLLSRAGKEGTD